MAEFPKLSAVSLACHFHCSVVPADLSIVLLIDPQKQADIETGLTEKDITNKPGQIYFIPQGSQIRNIPPGEISEQVVRFQRDRVQAMIDIGGMAEVTEGKMPSPNAAASTVKALDNRAIGRIRLKDRINQHDAIKVLGELTYSNILQYWPDGKKIKLENKNGNIESIVFNKLDYEDLKYEIHISPGSMAGVDRESYNTYMMGLLAAQHITFDEFLEVIDLPKKEKLLDMINNRKQSEAEAMGQELEAAKVTNIELKGTISPELLGPEEKPIFEQLMREKQLQQIGVSIPTNPVAM